MQDAEIKENHDWFSDEIATFGDRLAGAREAKGLSQQDLAERLGVKLSTVLDWENDLNDPRANKLQFLAGVLNVSLTWLLTGEGDGLKAPAPGEPSEAVEILEQMRNVRGQITALTAQLGSLENRLRTAIGS